MTRELVDLQKEEERKYQQALDQLKEEAAQDAGRAGDKLKFEVQEYKSSLEDESGRTLREHQREADEIVRREEDRLERERELEL